MALLWTRKSIEASLNMRTCVSNSISVDFPNENQLPVLCFWSCSLSLQQFCNTLRQIKLKVPDFKMVAWFQYFSGRHDPVPRTLSEALNSHKYSFPRRSVTLDEQWGTTGAENLMSLVHPRQHSNLSASSVRSNFQL